MEINKLVIIKFVELGLAVICISFHYKSETLQFDCDTLSSVAFGGYIILIAGSIIGHLMSAPIDRKVETFYCLVGSGIFVAAGAMNIEYFEKFARSDWKHFGIAKAAVAIANGGVFILDCILTWRQGV